MLFAGRSHELTQSLAGPGRADVYSLRTPNLSQAPAPVGKGGQGGVARGGSGGGGSGDATADEQETPQVQAPAALSWS